MLIELHAIQNFVPSNLNRDDTGVPKSCVFGGVTRARISSQSFKRAMRSYFGDHLLLDKDTEIGERTRDLVAEVGRQLASRTEMSQDEALKAAKEIFQAGGITTDTKKDVTDILLFLSPQSIDRLASAVVDNLSQLRHKDQKDKTIREDAYKRLGAILVESAHIPHIALFGRMIEVKGSTPFGKFNLGAEGAAQVAHPFSTHEARNEVDYFTAKEDRNTSDPGAAMVGMMEFNSACYYRYANIDITELHKNLKGDDALVRKTTNAFVRAFQHAVPIGKQRSFAPQNPPSFTLGVARTSGAWSLANAFAQPVTQNEGGGDGLITNSIVRLDRCWHQLVTVYPDAIQGRFCVTTEDVGYANLMESRVPTFEAFVQQLLDAALQAGSV